jgi:hypothetical protein
MLLLLHTYSQKWKKKTLVGSMKWATPFQVSVTEIMQENEKYRINL